MKEKKGLADLHGLGNSEVSMRNAVFHSFSGRMRPRLNRATTYLFENSQ
jgi:hypothetical protein